MALIKCDFEESEYRGPLFNQLGQGTGNVWEPGQVFERHIGIDYSIFVTNPDFWDFLGLPTLTGVLLYRRNLDFIRRKRVKQKKMPNYKLNLFIQAKRPEYGKRAPANLKEEGLNSPFWRFTITPHQQIALEMLKEKVGANALVTYACPCFHKQGDLYKHTTNQTIIENSTFPEVDELKGHSAWNYSHGGFEGVANTKPKKITAPSILERIKTLVKNQNDQQDQASVVVNLKKLASYCDDIIKNLSETAEAFEYSQLISDFQEASRYLDLENVEALISIMKVYGFCRVYKLNWMVVG